MGGSSSGGGNSNAQLFSLMSQYGDGGTQKPQPSFQDVMRQTAQGLAGNSHAAPNFQALFNAAFGEGNGTPGGSSVAGSGNPVVVGGGGTGATGPAPQWAFPQYTQTWAFTPPPAFHYMTPDPFDPVKYGNPLPASTAKKK